MYTAQELNRKASSEAMKYKTRNCFLIPLTIKKKISEELGLIVFKKTFLKVKIVHPYAIFLIAREPL